MRSSFHLLLAAAAMSLAPLSNTRAQDAGDPTLYMVSYIEAAPASKPQAVALLKQLSDASRKDAGAMRFEILQRTAPSNQFVILEVWKDQQALDAHAAAVHAKQFREKLQPLLIAPVDDRLCIATAVGPAPAAGGEGALYVVTHVDVGPPNRDNTIVALKALADATRKDPGNVRFDVVQQKARTNHFTVIELWKDQQSDDTHELAAHTKEFRSKLGPMAGALYDQRWYTPL
jgi:quinol monooxygenase YgiN